MKYDKVEVQVTMTVEILIEREEDNHSDPATLALKDLRGTPISNWWTRLHADYEFTSMLVVGGKSIAACEVHGHDWTHNGVGDPDMTAYCTRCGERET